MRYLNNITTWTQATVGLDTLIMKGLVILFLLSILSLTAGRHTSIYGPRRGKIIGGNEARPRSHPYLVSLHMRFLWTSLRLCSGSLLSEKWILTAGHCLKGSWLINWLPMEALVGTNDLVQKASSVQTVSIADRQIHPHYRGRLGAYDIAMLKTAMDIQLNNAVYPIALPFTIENYRYNVNNLILAGWGDLETTAFMPAFHNKLQEASVMNMPFKVCASMIEDVKNAIHDYHSSPMDMIHNICSGRQRDGVAACNGDSGAPLIQYAALHERESTSTPSEDIEPWSEGINEIYTTKYTIKHIDSDETTTTESYPLDNELTVADLVQQYIDQGLTPVAIGVVSWGPCGLVGAPTVYNNVSMYADFIQQYLYT